MPLLGERFRASPDYDLIVADCLQPAQRERLADSVGGELFGVLRLRGEPAAVGRPADRDLALLFLALREPGRVPRSMWEDLGDKAIAELVLDGILEMERDNRFIGGPAAAHAVLTLTSIDLVPSRTAQLSLEALRYGQELPGLSPGELAFRLYAFGRRPLSPVIRRRLSSLDTIDEFLGLAGDRLSRKASERSWRALPRPSADHPWRVLRSRAPAQRRPRGAEGYKLYVSPSWRELPEALVAVIEAASGSRGARAVKVAGLPEALCRPDKLVAYFDDLDGLRTVAARLVEHGAAWSAHGVPFTAALTDDGVLSWGVDPPRATGLGSWREWVTRRLAQHLYDARAAPGCVVEPWRYAIERIRLDGVDPESWSPLPARFATPVPG